MASMAAYLAIASFLSLASSLTSASVNGVHTQTSNTCSDSHNYLACEIEEMNLKITRLELLLEMTSLELDEKSLYIENCEKKLEELSPRIHQLESVLSKLKVSNPSLDTSSKHSVGVSVNVDVSDEVEKISSLEEQVRELGVIVRKNDRELLQLKARTADPENRVKLLASRVETMANVVPELWFHVQKLEQAREVIQRRTAELRMHIRNQKCSFFKFINKFSGGLHLKLASGYSSEAVNQLKRSFLAIKKYHHQLQGFVKQEMGRNEFTAVLADEELVFILASAIIVFPLIIALIWLSSLQ